MKCQKCHDKSFEVSVFCREIFELLYDLFGGSKEELSSVDATIRYSPKCHT